MNYLQQNDSTSTAFIDTKHSTLQEYLRTVKFDPVETTPWPDNYPSPGQFDRVAKVYEDTKTLPINEAVKADQGKLDWSLLPFDTIEEIVKVLEYGKIKYSAHNWSSGNGFKYTRVINALLRHLFAFMRGEDNDPETGLSHISHCACNIIFLLHFIKNKDRYNTCDDRHYKN